MVGQMHMYLLFATVLWPSVSASSQDFSVSNTNFTTWNQQTWSLATTSFLPGQYQSRISLANGYVGASLAAAGPFFEADVNQTDPDGLPPLNGWPLFDTRIAFSTISGFFDIQPNGTGTNYPWLNQYGWESFIAGIPHPTAIIFEVGGHVLDAKVSNDTISNFTSSLSFKTGVATWNYTWTPAGDPLSVSFAAFFSRVRPNVIAVEASITSPQDLNGTVTDVLDGSSAVRSYLSSKTMISNSTTIHSAVHPNGLANVTGHVFSTAAFNNNFTNLSSRSSYTTMMNESTIGQRFNVSLKAAQTAVFRKFVGVASTDKFVNAEGVASGASSQADSDGWDTLLTEHVKAWADLMPESTVDNFTDPTTGLLPDSVDTQILQIASVANTFYLLQNLQPDDSGLNDNSIAVGGLVSDSYAGLIFWDADYWMAPGLNIAFPRFSEQISNFRTKQHPQALANAAFNGYPNGSSLYPWTAGRYGNCTGTGPCVDYEYHLNYDIAFNLLQQYNTTNNKTWFDEGPRQLIESTAMMTGQLVSYNDTTKTWWIRNMTDPDEYANNVDNGAFTVASAADLLIVANQLRIAQGQIVNATWASQAENMEFPRAASNITLEYQTMNDSVEVKQADVVLLTYPLDYNEYGYTKENKILDLEYYSNRQSPNGPAMTYSVFAADANALDSSGCAAYTYTLNGIQTYLRAPWYQFSEQAVDDPNINGGTDPAFPFLTGHGGAHQIFPFGMLGLRTDQEVLFINPSLPPQIPQVRLRKIYYGGAGIYAFMNQTHTTITRVPTTVSEGVIDKYANGSMPFMVGTPGDSSTQTLYQVLLNQTVTVPNRIYYTNLTYAGNLLQCLPVTTTSAFQPGQFPVAAIDGSSATRWQPTSNSSSSLTVNMTGVVYQPLDILYLDWGARPARSARIYLGNSTTVDSQGRTSLSAGETETVIQIPDIEISGPFDSVSASKAVVKPYVGNSTVKEIRDSNGQMVWTGRYARLEVDGCWEIDGMGATVSEFVLTGLRAS